MAWQPAYQTLCGGRECRYWDQEGWMTATRGMEA